MVLDDPRAVVLAGCGPHAAASHRAHPTEAPARSTARAYFGRTEIGSICAHMGPKNGDNSKPGPTCAVLHSEPIVNPSLFQNLKLRLHVTT